ncbi:hypothetical protein [Tsukamurella sp. NPDC003166]|uniref:hypothetical protein n=1 Tax=Tsukamurella sp. NPDC003166 TaxID=3154444 RepID=UPI0033B49278
MRWTTVAAAAIGCVVAGLLPAVAQADTGWNGRYSLIRSAASKTGTSLAARQWEPDFSDVYTFATSCASGTCVATVVDGPPVKNPTLPTPAKYTWNGTSWVHVYDWQWDCYMGEGREKVYAPAHSVAVYTPRADGTLSGTWRTDITGGPCAGSVVMNVAAVPAP